MVTEVRGYLRSRKMWLETDARGRESWLVTKGEKVGDTGDSLIAGTVVDSYRIKQ